MNQRVSKVRARRIRDIEKQAERRAAEKRPLLQRPGTGFLMLCLLWVLTVVVVDIEQFMGTSMARSIPLAVTADAAFLLIGLFVSALFIRLVAPDIAGNNRTILMLCAIALLAILTAKGVDSLARSTFFIPPRIVGFLMPLAMAPLMGAILLNASSGALLGIYPAMAMAVMLDYDFTVLLSGLLVCAVAAQMANGVRVRSKVIRAGLIVGLIESFAVLATTSLAWHGSDIMLVINQAGACLLSGFLSALLVLVILPLFESAFEVTTNLSLLDLSDLSHPLLQRLAIEAPGTYHHSLVVANLAQAGAEEIGANSLLARVCAYFHDVGKLTKPDFFAENIMQRANPHDDLPPSMSKLVITSHVKEGITLAMLHKLPSPVRAVIGEHHGTSIVSCFHHKARQSEDADGKVDEGSFRYPGPRPSFKESAIISLADGAEAASRSLEKPTPNHIEQVVTTIFNKRIIDGQLDDSSLTVNELVRVRRAFVSSLTNMLHARVPYPEDEDNSQQPTKTMAREPADDRKPEQRATAPGTPG